MSKNIKKKRFMKRRLFIVISVVILIGLIISKIFSVPKIKYNEQTVLIIGDSVQKLENTVIVDEYKTVYVSYDDVKNIYDSNIYYDDVNKKLITTYNKHIALLELDKNEIEINDAQSSINGKLQYIDNVLYIPFSDMKLVYDFEYSYSDLSNTVMVDSISTQKKEGTTNRRVTIKGKASLFGKKLLKINKDEKLTIYGIENNYYKIRTQDGIIGYVKQSKIDNVETVREDMTEKKIENVNILSKYSDIKSDYENAELDGKKYNAVIPEIFSITEDKKIDLKVSLKGDAYANYKEWLDANNINLWATVTNDEDISNLMLTYDDRKEIINNIHQKMIENQYKVINIKFDKINDVNSFYRFLIELTPRLRESGIKTVVTYNNVFNEEKVSKIVDYIVKEEK